MQSVKLERLKERLAQLERLGGGGGAAASLVAQNPNPNPNRNPNPNPNPTLALALALALTLTLTPTLILTRSTPRTSSPSSAAPWWRTSPASRAAAPSR